LLLKEVSETGLFELARREGMVTMQEDGILKVVLGITTFKEVEDVTGKIEWR
jgi:type II secretory ATPase GspE/PulE/Tfp pilus assembly ATPase PilB-like protein